MHVTSLQRVHHSGQDFQQTKDHHWPSHPTVTHRTVTCNTCKLAGKYLGDGRTPDGDHVARQPVEVLADELQGLGPHHPVNQVYAVQQRWHCLGEGTKVVGQRLQTVQQLSFDAHALQY